MTEAPPAKTILPSKLESLAADTGQGIEGVLIQA